MNLKQVQAWIDEQQRMISSQYCTTITSPQICVYASQVSINAFGATKEYAYKFRTGQGATLQEAIDGLIGNFPNAFERAAKLREAAQAMVLEASKLEREANQ